MIHRKFGTSYSKSNQEKTDAASLDENDVISDKRHLNYFSMVFLDMQYFYPSLINIVRVHRIRKLNQNTLVVIKALNR